MKKARGSLSALLALLLVVSLAACSGGGAPAPAPAPANNAGAAATESSVPETETQVIEGSSGITLRLTWSGDGQNKAALDECLRKYTEKTGIGIEVIFVNGGWADYFTKIQTMTAGGEVLDVANVAVEGFQMLVDLGLASPIDDWIANNKAEYDAVVNDIDPAVMNVMNFNGQQYGVPNEWNNVVTHINTALLADAGLEAPPADWNKDLFLDYCSKLTKDKEDGTKQYALIVPNYYFGFDSWLYNNGTSFMNEDFTKSNLLDPAVIEMYQLLYDLVYTYGYSPIPEPGLDAFQMFEDGILAMHWAGRWPTGKYHTDGFKDVTIQYNPIFKENVTIWGGTGAFTLKSSPNFDEATKLGLYLASAPFVEEWMGAGAIPVLNSVADKIVPSLGIPQNSELFKESAANARAVEAPAQYAEVAILIDRTFSDILVNKEDIVATLTAADAELNMILMDNQ